MLATKPRERVPKSFHTRRTTEEAAQEVRRVINMEEHNKQLQEVANEVASEKLKFENEIETLDDRVKGA